jgi:hypothetical protein
MIIGRYVAIVGMIGGLVLAFGCSKKESSPQTSSASADNNRIKSDSEQIQDVLDEVVTRWHYGDKGGMYDMEFEYLQDRYTFDQYLEFSTIKPLSADTMERMIVTGVSVVPKESAQVYVDVVFKGPTGQTSIAKDTHTFFYDRGRWVRPLAGAHYLQLEYEQLKRSADSAAAEEAKHEGH